MGLSITTAQCTPSPLMPCDSVADCADFECKTKACVAGGCKYTAITTGTCAPYTCNATNCTADPNNECDIAECVNNICTHTTKANCDTTGGGGGGGGTVEVKEPELNIITPAPDAKIVLPTIKVKGETVPNDPNAVIEWNTVIGKNETIALTAQTASGVEGQMEMSKLPSLNSSFGDNKVIAKAVVNGEVIDEKEVAVVYYFPLTGTQNPSGLPNWYYYWKKTAANCSVNHVYGGDQCADGYGYHNRGDSFFHICSAANGHNPVTGHYGIDTFAETCIHENTHLNDYKSFWPNGYDISQDGDRDHLPDDKEEALGYDPKYYKTYIYSNYRDDYADYTENRAYANEHLWKVDTAKGEDWADPRHE